MNNYFFSNKTWGPCYTVMAESKEEAIKKLKAFFKNDKAYKSGGEYMEVRKKRTVGEFKRQEGKHSKQEFNIEEFKSDEVIETEYS